MLLPPAHAFNPIAALRTLVSAEAAPDAMDALFAHGCGRGQAGDSVEALAPVLMSAELSPSAIEAPAMRSRLRTDIDVAIAAGVFRVATLHIGDSLFRGEDVHDFARAARADPGLRDTPAMQRRTQLPIGAARA